MKQKLIKKILQEVKQSYDSISSDFARTRQNPWPDIERIGSEYLKSGISVLDVGCGNGRMVEALASCSFPVSYTGVDNSRELLALAWEKYKNNYKDVKINWQEAELYDLPLADNSFDLIYAIASVHHIPSKKLRQKTLAELNRVLKPGGILIMSNWSLWTFRAFQKYNLWVQLFFNILKGYDWGDFIIPWKNSRGEFLAARYYHSFSQAEQAGLAKKNNFKIIKNSKEWYRASSKSVARRMVLVVKKIDK